MSKTAPYRAEERDAHTGEVLAGINFADSEAAAAFWSLRLSSAAPADTYAFDAPRRLVLLGPDRTVLPAAITEGPEL